MVKINRNEITDINSAKSLKYDGRDLSDKQKEIFDKLGSNPQLSLIQDAAELLWWVIQAENATKFDISLYNDLKNAKISKKVIYDIINDDSSKQQYDEAISNLLSKRE